MLGALTEGGYCSIGPTCAPGAMCAQIQQMGTVVNGVCVPVRFPIDLQTTGTPSLLPVPVANTPALLPGSDVIAQQQAMKNNLIDFALIGGLAAVLGGLVSGNGTMALIGAGVVGVIGYKALSAVGA